MANQSAYAKAGVDIEAGQRAAELMKTAVQSTFGPEVLSDVGHFGGLFAAGRLQKMVDPVLAASTDGVGTKTLAAARLGRWDTIGRDIVNHCVNDILVQGARPLFFLDYVAAARLEPEQAVAVVQGIAAACREAGCAFLDKFPGKIINLHPALPGQFAGTRAIERAYEAYRRGEIEHSGCMVHYVVPEVDAGPVVGTAVVSLYPDDTLAGFAARMHAAEHKLIVVAVRQVIE